MLFLRRMLGLTIGAISFCYLIFVLNPIQMMSVILKPLSPNAMRAVNRWCARSIWGFWVVLGESINNIDMRFTGDHVPRRENGLIIPNHQTMADVFTLLCFGWRCGRLGDTKWFVKDVIKYFPGFGWGMKFLDNVFVKRDWTQDRAGIHQLFEKYKREEIPIFLISFLEGTRKTPSKLAKAQEYARERNIDVPKQTLVPRTKGFVATMIGLRDHLDAVYDLTIAYPKTTPTLMNCFEAKVQRIEVHVRRFPIESMPTDEEELARWAHERWREKDALLARFEEEQRFPGTPWPDEVRVLDWFLPEGHRFPKIAQE